MPATLITGATVWDGISAQSAPRQVLVVDGRIQRVADAIEAPSDTRVEDLPGHTLTPGFIDCHTHVTLAPPVGLLMALDSSIAKTLKSLPVLRALLMNGFTTVRDLGCGDIDYPTIDLRNAVAAGLVVGPRMLVAPHMISAVGGSQLQWPAGVLILVGDHSAEVAVTAACGDHVRRDQHPRADDEPGGHRVAQVDGGVIDVAAT